MSRVDRFHALVALQHVGIGSAAVCRLEARLGRVEVWWEGRRARDLEASGVRPEPAAGACADEQVATARARATRLGYRESGGQELGALVHLPDPPLRLWVAGSLPDPDRPAVGIVGARRASAYGLRVAGALGRDLAAAGATVVSGLARGIDGAAHRGALAAGGATVAVLGSGPDVPYPPEHAELLQEISRSGGAVTEHLPGTPPRAHHFPRRNRLLVALSDGLVVAEARLKSGTATSVRWALDLGKEVMAVPGPVDQALGQGTLALIRDGATPVGTAAEILEALGYASSAMVREDNPHGLSPPEARLLDLLQGGALDLDELARISGEPPGRLLALLLNLEVRGRVVRDAGMAYRLP